MRSKLQGLSLYKEAQVVTVVRLYDTGLLGSDPSKSRRSNLMNYLTDQKRGLKFSVEDAEYWLNWLGVS